MSPNIPLCCAAWRELPRPLVPASICNVDVGPSLSRGKNSGREMLNRRVGRPRQFPMQRARYYSCDVIIDTRVCGTSEGPGPPVLPVRFVGSRYKAHKRVRCCREFVQQSAKYTNPFGEPVFCVARPADHTDVIKNGRQTWLLCALPLAYPTIIVCFFRSGYPPFSSFCTPHFFPCLRKSAPGRPARRGKPRSPTPPRQVRGLAPAGPVQVRQAGGASHLALPVSLGRIETDVVVVPVDVRREEERQQQPGAGGRRGGREEQGIWRGGGDVRGARQAQQRLRRRRRWQRRWWQQLWQTSELRKLSRVSSIRRSRLAVLRCFRSPLPLLPNPAIFQNDILLKLHPLFSVVPTLPSPLKRG